MRRSKSQIYLESPEFANKLYYRSRKRDNELTRQCVRCPNTVTDNHACCQACRATMRDGKQQAREHGLCLDCWTEPAVPGKRYCASHDEQRKQRDSTTYTERLIRHLCVKCGRKRAQGGRTTCAACHQKRRLAKASRQHPDPTIKEAVQATSGPND